MKTNHASRRVKNAYAWARQRLMTPRQAPIGDFRRAGYLLTWLGTMVVILLIAGSGLSPFDGTGASIASTSFAPTADTFIAETPADANYGQGPTLKVDTLPTAMGALLRFQVTGVPRDVSVQSATLRLFVVNYSQKPGVVHAVSGAWSEDSTTWTNAPNVGSMVTSITGPAIVGTWVSADVTAAVTGNGAFDFYVIPTSPDGVYYSSGEGANVPTLTVQWLQPTGAPPPTATPTRTPSAATPLPTLPGLPVRTATRTPTAPGATTGPYNPAFQPAAPIQAGFFYPWFANAWTQGGVFPFSRYQPTYGYYSSSDDAIIDQQLRLASRAHLEAMISSWWGQGHHTDNAFRHILERSERSGSPYPNMRWTTYYEPEGYGDPTPQAILNDLNYLAANYFNHSGYLRVNGKPVVFVWSGVETCAMADRWAQAKQLFGGNVHIVLKVFSGYASCPNQPDSWHQYGPATAFSSHMPHGSTVSPGFWHINEAAARLGRDPARFEADVRRMVGTGAFWQLVTSWNEWGEGTGIEPTTQFGEVYIEILCRNLPGPAPCGGSGGAPVPTAQPTPVRTQTVTPTPPPPPPPSGGDAVLVGAGDIASCSSSGDEATASLLDGIAGTVITMGDNVYESGTATEFANCYEPSWGRHKARTRPAVGNHEYLTSGASGYYGYFGAAAGAATMGYYAYDAGSWRVYVLNSSNVNKAAELVWLQAQLAANPRQCVMAYFHHAVLTAGPHADDEGSMRDMWRALWDAGADLVVAGHDHSYQRYAPLNRDATGPAAGGMREIIVGTGGKGLTTQDRVPAGLEVAMDGNTNTAFGVIKLTLRSGSFDWQFVPVAGKTFTDSGSQACR